VNVHIAILLTVLALALALFVWGRIRYDAVALLALLALVVTGTVAPAQAFLGFGHPAVVTVAAVLVVSRALANEGAVDLLAASLSGVGRHPVLLVGALCLATALASAFINNVGALALLMPVAIRMARERSLPPSLVLMPIAFASLLGGMTTLIGTPPNIIVAAFRAREVGEPFGMFAYAPVGVAVALAGIAFLGLWGWRLLPRRGGATADEVRFELESYLTEVRVGKDSALVGKALGEVVRDADVSLAGFVRGEKRFSARSRYEELQAGDILVLETEAAELKSFVSDNGLEMVGRGKAAGALLRSDEVHIEEAVALPDAMLLGRTPAQLRLRHRYDVNLLAVSRQGTPIRRRLRDVHFRAGDVLLLEGARAALNEAMSDLGCLPLASRNLRIGRPRRLAGALGLFVLALAAVVLRLVPPEVALTAAVLGMLGIGVISGREAYRSVDWPVVVLLGAMIPVGQAMETTGAAQRIADLLGGVAMLAPPLLAVLAILLVTMMLSDVVNNAAAAVLMSPLAVAVAHQLGLGPDPFLMAVAIGASCAFLTPIGHQSNTLVMGPGGYRFGDYWKLGVPVELIVVVVAMAAIPLAWPLVPA
jgi:di/tricarboxylate transporter